MKRLAVCFSARGAGIIEKLSEECSKKELTPLVPYAITASADISPKKV